MCVGGAHERASARERPREEGQTMLKGMGEVVIEVCTILIDGWKAAGK